MQSPFATPESLTPVNVDKERIQRETMRKVFTQLRKYSKEARLRGWSGPEQVYLLAIEKLKEDVTLG